MKRKLKKIEVMIISRIFEAIGFKSYVEYLLGSRLEKMLKMNENQQTKGLIVVGDITAFVMQNMYKAENLIDTLVMSYLGKDENYVADMDADAYLAVVKDCFLSALPTVITDYIEASGIKKKLKSIMAQTKAQKETEDISKPEQF